MNELAISTQGARFTEQHQQIILDTVLSGASKEEAGVLLAVAKARNLNPLLGEIHFVKRWDSAKGREVWAFQVSIDGLRVIAERTGEYDGQDEPEEVIENGKVAAVKVRVYRKNVSRPFVGVARMAEFAQKKKDGTATKFWATMPTHMLAKCAEALALRKAFPQQMAGLYTGEEMVALAEESSATSAQQPTRPAASVTSKVKAMIVDAATSKAAIETIRKMVADAGYDPLNGAAFVRRTLGEKRQNEFSQADVDAVAAALEPPRESVDQDIAVAAQ